MKTEFHPMEIKGIAIDKQKDLPVMILQSCTNHKLLTIGIGPFEASAIIIEIEGVHPPRPLTHDLLTHFFRKHKFSIIKLELYDVFEENFYSRIIYKKGFKHFSMEVRPSDGIALALREHAPVFAHETVLKTSAENPIYHTSDVDSLEDILYLSNSSNNMPLM